MDEREILSTIRDELFDKYEEGSYANRLLGLKLRLVYGDCQQGLGKPIITITNEYKSSVDPRYEDIIWCEITIKSGAFKIDAKRSFHRYPIVLIPLYDPNSLDKLYTAIEGIYAT